MGLETATYINQLDATNPLGSDQKSQGDDHLRLIKSTIKNTFPNFGAAALNASNTQLDKVVTTITINSSAPANSVVIDSNGYAGFGGNPGLYAAAGRSEIDVVGSSSALIGFSVGAAARGYLASTTTTVELASNGAIDLTAGGSVRQRVTSAGQVAISTNGATPTPLASTALTTYGASGSGQIAVNNGTATTVLGGGTSSVSQIGTTTNTPLNFITNGVSTVDITAIGILRYNTFEVGYRDIPYQSLKTGAYTLTIADRGTMVPLGAGAAITVPSGAFGPGSTVTLINASGGALTITQGAGLTMYLTGTGTSGNRTLQNNAIATVHFYNSSVALVSGPGVS